MGAVTSAVIVDTSTETRLSFMAVPGFLPDPAFKLLRVGEIEAFHKAIKKAGDNSTETEGKFEAEVKGIRQLVVDQALKHAEEVLKVLKDHVVRDSFGSIYNMVLSILQLVLLIARISLKRSDCLEPLLYLFQDQSEINIQKDYRHIQPVA